MKYQIKKLEINNFDVFEQNKLTGRSYFIPYTDKASLLSQSALTERYSSDQVTVLSGKWNFKYFEKISRLPSNIDTDSISFDEITVPSTWQRTGYESPVYLNTRYAFPMTLPNVPDEMSAGIYVKKFNVKDASKHIIITFLGVCSSLTLYVNGKYVGYSEGSHNSAEFSLDGIVTEGENELFAIVSKWSNGTYLECQDMFRENGIFRDVYITENPKDYIFDYQVNTTEAKGGYRLSVSTKLLGSSLSDKTVTAELFDGEKVIASVQKSADDKSALDFGTLDVERWSAETPSLYTLLLTLSDGENSLQCIRKKIGFKTVKIEGEKFLFNSKLIKFKGVNHHDTHEKTGYVMSADDLLKDIELMKEFNVNAVRTSHYPPDPTFLDLCDEYGLYVIDEADIETHGTQVDQRLRFTLKANIISNDKKWLPRYEDRVMRMYERDKNHVSVTMWSLGNESGGWKNQDECYKKLKEVSSLPVHYEGVIRTRRGSYDVISEMYQVPQVLSKIAEHKFGKRYQNKPYFLCEYCHAMGVGPGLLEDYWSLIYANEQLTGGCIWEWADHSVYDKNAKYKYTYGGDHGEAYHDDNFCVDGLFYPDRTPHTGAYEMKNVYRPVRCELVSDNTYRFRNTNSFIGTEDLKVAYQLLENGKVSEEGAVELDIEPMQSKEIKIGHKAVSKETDCCINFIYTDKKTKVVAKEQIVLSKVISEPEIRKEGELSVLSKKDKIVITFEGGKAVFSKTNGALIGYTVGDKELVSGDNGFTANLYRAYLDNERNIVKIWKKLGINELETKFNSIKCSEKNGAVKVKSESYLTHKGKPLFEFEMKYEIYADGTMKVKAEVERRRLKFGNLDIPRFGVNLKLDKALENVSYYGLGELENLPDFEAQSALGIYEAKVEDMNVDYIRPQDNGNHGKCRWAKLTDADGKGVMVCAKDDTFSFSVHNHSDEVLEKARHIEDIKDEGIVSLNIDGFVRGTGTNSCGPDTLKQYRFEFKDELEFSFYVVPVK